MQKKCIHIIIEGLLDKAYAELNNKTPLQAAETPTMDRIANMSLNCLYHGSKVGLPTTFELLNFFLLGYNYNQFPGLSALEVLGNGIKINHNDIAIKTKLACVKKSGKNLFLLEGNPEIGEGDLEILFDTIRSFETENIQLDLYRTERNNGIILLNGDASPYITDTNPLRIGSALVEVKPLDKYSKDIPTLNTANIIKSYLLSAHETLKKHEINARRTHAGLPSVNFLLTSQSGKLNYIKSFKKKYGFNAVSIVDDVAMQGLTKYLQMDHINPFDTSDIKSNITNKLEKSIKLINNYNYIHIHEKIRYKPGLKNIKMKVKEIEAFDKGLNNYIDNLLNNPEILLVITSAPSNHPWFLSKGEPVTITFYGNDIPIDKFYKDDGISTARNSARLIRGNEFIYMLLNFMNMSKPVGVVNSREHNYHWPVEYEPFSLDD